MEIIVDNEIFDTDKCGFIGSDFEYLRYLKGKYNSNFKRCESRLFNPLLRNLKKNGLNNLISIVEPLIEYWDMATPFSYKEAFKIEDEQFRALVFSSINIREMINELGATKIKVEGIELNNKSYNEIIKSFENEDYSYVSELYEVNGEKIGLNDKIYVVKVWCTSTNEEHWLWVDENNCSLDSPLDAIASTCMIYKSMVGKIKHIIRQGDVFLFEMVEKVNINPDDEIVRIPKSDYFKLLKSQS